MLKNKFTVYFILVLLFFPNLLFADGFQIFPEKPQKDTITIVDTVYVYETIYVYDTLEYLSSKAQVLIPGTKAYEIYQSQRPEIIEKKSKIRFQASAYYMPLLFRLNRKNNVSEYNLVDRYVDNLSKEETGIATGVLFSIRKKAFALETGIGFTNFKQTPNYFVNRGFSDTLYQIHSYDTTKLFAHDQVKFIDIPLQFSYQLTEGDIKIEALAGLNLSLFQSAKTKYYPVLSPFEYQTKSVDYFRNWHLSILLGLRLNYFIRPRYGVYLEPMYRKSLQSWFPDDYLIDTRYQIFTARFGMFYQF